MGSVTERIPVRWAVGLMGENPNTILGVNCRHWSEWDKENLTLVSGNIDAVTDFSTYSNNITQPTGANRPLYVAGGLNGNGVGRFNGTAHWMIADWLSSLFGGTDTPFTCWAVLNKDDTTSNGMVFSLGASGNGNNYCYLNLSAADQYSLTRRDGGATSSATGGLYPATGVIVAVRFDGSNVEVFENNVSEFSGNSDVGNIASDQGGIGVLRRNTLSSYFNGDVGSLVYSDLSESDENIISVGGYLNSKYLIS